MLAGLGMQSKTSFEKNCFSAWASTLNMVDMVCLSSVGYDIHHIPQATNIPYQPC